MLTDGIKTWYMLDTPIPTNLTYRKHFIASNYGKEEFDDIAYLNVNYYRDFVKQVDTNSELIEALLVKYPL